MNIWSVVGVVCFSFLLLLLAMETWAIIYPSKELDETCLSNMEGKSFRVSVPKEEWDEVCQPTKKHPLVSDSSIPMNEVQLKFMEFARKLSGFAERRSINRQFMMVWTPDKLWTVYTTGKIVLEHTQTYYYENLEMAQKSHHISKEKFSNLTE